MSVSPALAAGVPTTDRVDYSAFVTPAEDGACRLDLAVDGITCAACIREIEDGVAGAPGLRAARLNYTTRRLTVTLDEGADAAAAVARLERLGYRAYPFTQSREEAIESAETKDLLTRLGVAAFAAMNIMLLSVSVWSGNVSDIDPETRDLFHWLSALIAIPAVAYSGQPFFKAAIRSIRAGGLGMDVPISLGVLLAVGVSLWETAHSATHAYFDSAVMLLAFLLAGRVLDQAMRKRTRAVAGNLIALRGDTARRIDADGGVTEIPVLAVKAGERLAVRPGDRIAVDGIVEEGTSEIDASLVTGETAHEPVAPGATVHSGTLNVSGALVVRATAAAESSLVAEVNKLLDAALLAKSRYVRIADRAARLYSPVVHATALLTALGWLAYGAGPHFAILTAVAVLIITCPCALGLAVPAVQVVVSGALFKAGVLLSAGDGVERIAACDTVVLDKTGTLTTPEARIANRADAPDDLLALAARLAQTSSHPLARALMLAASRDGLDTSPLADAREEPGRGVVARFEGVEARLGSADFCGAREEAARALAADPDATAIAVSLGERRAVLTLRQTLKDDAAATVARLKGMGLAVLIVSGDREGPVSRAAAAVGIETWHAGAKPGDKTALIESLTAQGRRVLMVGDGLNDAPALAAAHASLSPISASHLAQTCADALVVGDRLLPVADAVALTRRALRIMRQNLWLATLYNLVAVPIAVAGFVTPLVAALAMSGSSIVVTVNALRAQARTRSRAPVRAGRSAAPRRRLEEVAP
ncbi:heavy metal translocating P-type ATPase [Salinarimonas ramus]|uniref:heavy metal translocating P-type ATPase n=1 Tax=Salinarimonas ramus TaxID=690164 RepID=UPI00166BBE93|nr:heavy metal translocating P-type ATPase [Salinarimonas ramus]